MDRLLTFGFGQPWWLLLLALVPVVARFSAQAGPVAAVRFSGLNTLREMGVQPLSTAAWTKRLWLASLVLLIIAMARPRIEQGTNNDKTEGVNIVFCCDVSGSMDTKDFILKGQGISRREALVMAISEFVDKRTHDRFGMVGFATQTYLMSPLTIDGEWIKGVLKNINTQGGTAIGDGILSSLDLMKKAQGNTKVIIVVTDGQNNAGTNPLKAAEEAKKQGVKVYTVEITSLRLVGSPSLVKGMMSQIADITNGQYFAVATIESMFNVYRDIDRLVKEPIEAKRYKLYDELYAWAALPAFALLLVGWGAAGTKWGRIP